MATITSRKMKDGSTHYYSDLRIGKKRYKRFLGLSRQTALKALQELEYELRYGEVKSTLPSWEDAIVNFLIQLELSGITREQVKHNESRLRDFKRFCEHQKVYQLDEITTKHCQDYMASRSKVRTNKKYNLANEKRSVTISVKTLNVEIAYHKRFFRYCVTNEWLNRNPFDPVKRIRDKTRGKPRYSFTAEDIDRIFEGGGKFNDFYYFLLHTGLRSTDAFALKASDIDGQYLTLQMKKTGDWLKRLPLPQHVIERLGDRLEGDGIVFPEIHSDRQKRNARKLFQSLFTPDEVREKNINYHTFRHTYAHNMLAAGIPKEVLQTFMGHRSIRTTEIYANWVSNSELSKWV